MYDIRRFSLP